MTTTTLGQRAMTMISRNSRYDTWLSHEFMDSGREESVPEHLLAREMDERHAYMRVSYRLFVQWCIFFFGLNWVAMGFSLQSSSHGREIIAWLFITQCAAGMIICAAMRRYVRRTSTRIEAILAQLAMPFGGGAEMPMPTAIYDLVAMLACICIGCNMAVWGWIVVYLSG